MRANYLCLLLACEFGDLPGDDDGPVPILPERWPTLDAPCVLEPDAPNGLLVTTTDFSTGAVSIVDARTREVTADVAVGTTDGIPFFAGGRGLVVHRFQYDFVDVLDPRRGFASMGQHGITIEGNAAPNPRSIAVAHDGLGYVPLFGVPAIAVMDLQNPPGQSQLDAIDVRSFADDDGSPEASIAIACGDALFVTIDRVDTSAGFVRVGGDALVAVDLLERTALDLDPDREGAQGIALRGAWVKQLRVDPADPDRLTLLALTDGIERIDLRDGTTTYAVTPDAFAEAGIVHYQLPLAFDVEGDVAYVAAYAPLPGESPDCSDDPGPCFGQARLFRVGLDGAAPEVPEAFAEGFDASERTLEVIGDALWYGSRKTGAPGLWVFDITTDPPSRVTGPLGTGLPPYSLTAAVLP